MELFGLSEVKWMAFYGQSVSQFNDLCRLLFHVPIVYFYEVFAFLVTFISFHWVWQNHCYAHAYTTQTHDLCQHGEKRQKKTDVCFCGNDTEQLLSPHTYSLLRLWWLRVAQLHINSVSSTSILGPALHPWFLATCFLMTRPSLVGSRAMGWSECNWS